MTDLSEEGLRQGTCPPARPPAHVPAPWSLLPVHHTPGRPCLPSVAASHFWDFVLLSPRPGNILKLDNILKFQISVGFFSLPGIRRDGADEEGLASSWGDGRPTEGLPGVHQGRQDHAQPCQAWHGSSRVPAPKGPRRQGHVHVPPCSPHLLQAFAQMSPAH